MFVEMLIYLFLFEYTYLVRYLKIINLEKIVLFTRYYESIMV